MKKYIVLLAATAFLASGCKKKYEEGFAAGRVDGVSQGRTDGQTEGYNNGYAEGVSQVYDNGVSDGHADGLAQGYSEGQSYFATAGFDEGFSDGFAVGEIEGHQNGYEIGYNSAYNHHYNTNYAIGENEGYSAGYSNGASDGYDDGYNHGYDDGYDDAYDNGDSDGYSDGYNDGYSDGLGSSLASKNPAVKLAAMVNSDLIDYSKLQKFNSRSVLGTVAMSHADNGTVDMEKLAALKEKHYLNQMGRQIEAKFGLSSDRASKIAAVAHQFNKMAGTRTLTEKDANTFAVNVIGTNLKDMEKAIKLSMKGESSLLNSLLKDVAAHNETSPEVINGMISEIFF